MSVKNLQDAFMHELRDVYNAEKQILKALKKMARKATHDDLRTAFETHLEETQGQVERLEKCFELLDYSARGSHCEAMDGIIQEGKDVMSEAEEDAIDVMMIAAAQKVEHYEIATYGTLSTWASTLGHEEVAALLEETLAEEKATDEKLTELAMQLNKEAVAVG